MPISSATHTRTVIRASIESPEYTPGAFLKELTTNAQRDVIYHDSTKILTYTKTVKAFQHHEALRKRPALVSFDLERLKTLPAYHPSHGPL